MPTSRRDFLARSATAAAALSLGMRGTARAGEPVAPTSDDGPALGPMAEKMLRARPVRLANVRVLGGPLKHAQELDAKYLLSLDPDRMLAYYRIRAGLKPKAPGYTGWDGDGRNLTGHIAGHHLSAVSLMYLATGDDRFKQRAAYLVAGLKEVQDANGDGYLSALENGRKAFGELHDGVIRSAAFDLNGLWSPWYTLHKTFAGLRDAYRHTGNATALEVETKFATWAEGILAPLSAAQLAEMLNTEHGGMNEVLADLWADTGDRRWLDLSYAFEHHAFTDALKRGQDNLNGKHGNCQIPKLVGSAERFGYTGDAGDLLAASFFWDTVVQHHTYASGGHGLSEYFGPADRWSTRVNGRTCESCNVYNMLKLTRRLFALRPDAFYADFQERALYNHQLASIDPMDGDMSYMVPVGRGEQQEYQDMQRDFTCCVGTGMENHALVGYGVYYESDDTRWVTVFMPSTARFSDGSQLAMDTDFPDGGQATLTLTMPAPTAFTLAIRRPSWAGDGFRVRVNGQDVPQPPLASLQPGRAGGRLVSQDPRVPPPSTFVELTRTWKSGDRVELALPKTLRYEPTPDNPDVTAIMWGPLALAADLGPRRHGRAEFTRPPVPVLVAAGRPLADWMVPNPATPGNFTARGVARVPEQPAPPADVQLAPFYRTYERTYSLYQDVVTPAGFDARVAATAEERARARALEAATVSYARPGSRPDDVTFHYQSDVTDRQPVYTDGRSGRGGAGWFSYTLPADPAAPLALVITYYNEPGLTPTTGDFSILINDTPVAAFAPEAGASGFFDVRYAVPAGVTRGHAAVTVKFAAAAGGRIAPVYGVRLVRAGG
ncbi:MAG TPA: beta-L-arabinofuranosidase domain-containing protein [Gemmatimonadaceae bacterium]|nr:beta-L-arabinofuranosidase domain-containing protein [Gemmatimonadaceae bacterium]